MGWPGGLTDPKPSALRNVNTAFAQGMKENMMYTNDIDQALGQIRQQTGIDRFELVGMDALPGLISAFTQLAFALAKIFGTITQTLVEHQPALNQADVYNQDR